jgi:hypothetical protein
VWRWARIWETDQERCCSFPFSCCDLRRRGERWGGCVWKGMNTVCLRIGLDIEWRRWHYCVGVGGGGGRGECGVYL